MKFARPLLIASGIAASFALLIPLPASAHDTSKSLYATGSGNRLGYGGVTNNHTRIYACDTLGDGDGFRTEYKRKNGQRGYVDDANGSSTGCSDLDNVGSSSNPVKYFRVISKQSRGTDYWIYSAWITA